MAEVMHWADQAAEQIIKRRPDKKEYIAITGATPSGTLHIGNFREFIMGDFIARAIRHNGKNGMHYHYWDDYDVFRKVPKNMPNQDVLEKNLRKALVDVPDVVDGNHDNYAIHHEKEFEKLLPMVGLNPVIINNSEEYQKCVLADQIKTALESTDRIKEIMNRFRKEDLDKSWLPISIYCEKCKLEVENMGYEGDYDVSYECSCGDKQTFDIRKKGLAKLKYRIQVPAVWQYRDIDFESAGKDHYAAGGVFNLAPMIAKDVYKIDKALGFGFGWIGVKGGGQFSSSQGNIITLLDVLEIYEPEIVRYLFAGSRPGNEFSISFDLDVLKVYEDYDRCERIYFNKDEAKNEKEYEKQKRIYELSVIDKTAEKQPYQPSFRHLSTVLQIHDNSIDEAVNYFKDEIKDEADEKRFRVRAKCCLNWLEKYAPEDMRFKIQVDLREDLELTDSQKAVLKEVVKVIDTTDDDKELHQKFYDICQENNLETKDFFKAAYNVLIDKDKGPRLASFMLIIGKEKVKKLFEKIK